ncbi:MAG: hypothetical protein PHP26_08305 [Syntrophomonas sp.]|uniref:hypothetical protein n=1 Tax=Syntrophomonas sp. TaxID=2053627 RepID=UPI00260FFD83|nr:hypothetical protein [Syntrophomonas sp.]MDD2510225.1 hypothetical protein [Syntrophomonas sp.]MDD3879976.1 hypothetical protein [Syntrophomonas sp.]MDD4627164.1 hypothetical protein [Syntrophomonas sp.]
MKLRMRGDFALGKLQQGYLGQEAMTLLEVLLALVLLTLIANVALAIFTTSAIWIKHSCHESTASYYAASLLEELREKTENIETVSLAAPEELGLGEGYTPSIPPGISAKIDMERVNDMDRLYRVRVTVCWDEGEEKRKLCLVTMIRKEESGL